MATPQREHGHVQIANEIIDALGKTPLSSYETRIVWCVLRKTYGWQKKQDWIALSQFVEFTGISKPHVCRALRVLLARQIITKGGTSYNPVYGFQKDYEKWLVLPKGAPIKTHHPLPKGVIQGVPKGAHTKETITKEIISTFASQSVEPLKTKSKTMAFRAYDENNPSDDTPSVDADSGELVPTKAPKGRDQVATRVSQYFYRKAEEATGKKLVNMGYAHAKKFVATASEVDLKAVIDEYFDLEPSDPTNMYKCLNAKNINKYLADK